MTGMQRPIEVQRRRASPRSDGAVEIREHKALDRHIDGVAHDF